MIVGIGIDGIEIARMHASIERFGEHFLNRIFTAEEQAYCLKKQKKADESFAARFAAKEAGAKALGTGISRGVSWLEIEVTRLPGQRPELRLHGRARARAEELGVTHMVLSLTHTRTEAMAMVLMEAEGLPQP